MQELPSEEKEDYLSRAILLMHSQSMVGIVMEIKVFCRTPAEGPTEKRHFGNGRLVVVGLGPLRSEFIGEL